MGCPIDMERKGCESTECWTHVANFNFDLTYALDLEFLTSNFEIAVSVAGENDGVGGVGDIMKIMFGSWVDGTRKWLGFANIGKTQHRRAFA